MNKQNVPHILSLGAGVQSSTLALMAAHGEVEPMPMCAIFADTQDEPASVYRWLHWLEKQLPFPVHRVTKGKLSDVAVRDNNTELPLFTLGTDGALGKIPGRSCTVDYKIRPITKELRKLAGISRGQKTIGVVQWIGISLDEMKRMKTSNEKWIKHRWPLIEKRITRQHCKDWMESKGYPQPPRSACVYCPFHDNKEWRRLQTDEPEEFAKAVNFEKRLQEAKGNSENFHSTPFLHRSCKPLDTIDFRSDVERGQQLLWDDECEGMCGV